jgi:hypothetical protein
LVESKGGVSEFSGGGDVLPAIEGGRGGAGLLKGALYHVGNEGAMLFPALCQGSSGNDWRGSYGDLCGGHLVRARPVFAACPVA